MPPIAKSREEIRYLNTLSGLAFASKHLDLTPEEIEMIVGRYSRGKYAGLLRGAVKYDYYYYGGWKREGPGEMNGRVVRPGTIENVQIVDSFTRLPIKYSPEAAEKARERRITQYNIEHADEIAQIKREAERKREEHRSIIEFAKKELENSVYNESQRKMFEKLIESSKKALNVQDTINEH